MPMVLEISYETLWPCLTPFSSKSPLGPKKLDAVLKLGSFSTFLLKPPLIKIGHISKMPILEGGVGSDFSWVLVGYPAENNSWLFSLEYKWVSHSFHAVPAFFTEILLEVIKASSINKYIPLCLKVQIRKNCHMIRLDFRGRYKQRKHILLINTGN